MFCFVLACLGWLVVFFPPQWIALGICRYGGVSEKLTSWLTVRYPMCTVPQIRDRSSADDLLYDFESLFSFSGSTFLSTYHLSHLFILEALQGKGSWCVWTVPTVGEEGDFELGWSLRMQTLYETLQIMASDESTYNKRYPVINILCRFNQSFALRHKGPCLLLCKYSSKKSPWPVQFAAQSDTICPSIGHQDKKKRGH